MYLILCTRRDICFAVGRLSQYMEKYSKSLWSFIIQPFRYTPEPNPWVLFSAVHLHLSKDQWRLVTQTG